MKRSRIQKEDAWDLSKSHLQDARSQLADVESALIQSKVDLPPTHNFISGYFDPLPKHIPLTADMDIQGSEESWVHSDIVTDFKEDYGLGDSEAGEDIDVDFDFGEEQVLDEGNNLELKEGSALESGSLGDEQTLSSLLPSLHLVFSQVNPPLCTFTSPFTLSGFFSHCLYPKAQKLEFISSLYNNHGVFPARPAQGRASSYAATTESVPSTSEPRGSSYPRPITRLPASRASVSEPAFDIFTHSNAPPSNTPLNAQAINNTSTLFSTNMGPFSAGPFNAVPFRNPVTSTNPQASVSPSEGPDKQQSSQQPLQQDEEMDSPPSFKTLEDLIDADVGDEDISIVAAKRFSAQCILDGLLVYTEQGEVGCCFLKIAEQSIFEAHILRPGEHLVFDQQILDQFKQKLEADILKLFNSAQSAVLHHFKPDDASIWANVLGLSPQAARALRVRALLLGKEDYQVFLSILSTLLHKDLQAFLPNLMSFCDSRTSGSCYDHPAVFEVIFLFFFKEVEAFGRQFPSSFKPHHLYCAAAVALAMVNGDIFLLDNNSLDISLSQILGALEEHVTGILLTDNLNLLKCQFYVNQFHKAISEARTNDNTKLKLSERYGVECLLI
ncbi:hypothetical protein CVT26_001763 [Gymnopilus dilepis]|uniref:Uncharacterized protein n=1 Tax=Gymnopilus dilepis TaxID=231916 RepID=A0A409WE78_9AGAR|nr:hypothetical protein CVT26_001763 [Gymnopilus dilepis]